MLRSPTGLLTGAFMLGLLFVGLPLWLTPYSQVNVPDSLLGIGTAVVLVLSFLLRFSGIASFTRSLNVMAMTLPTALMLRVIVEGLMDPTKHNLWPLTLVIAVAMGYLTALPGAGLAHLLRWLGHVGGAAGADRGQSLAAPAPRRDRDSLSGQGLKHPLQKQPESRLPGRQDPSQLQALDRESARSHPE